MRILAAATAFCLTPLVFTTGSRAEDFSGFYAGLNAGYAFDKDHGRRDIGPGSGSSSSGVAEDTKLPPSAANAARAMQGAREETKAR